MSLSTASAVAARHDRFAYAVNEVAPLTPTIGAEISGIDLRGPPSARVAADIVKALHDWRIVVFRDQDIDNEALCAFGRAFGPLTPAHPIAEGLETHPEIWERSVSEYRARRSRSDARPPEERPPRDYQGWHIDITFVANPNRYSILQGVEIPPYGGDTVFANLVAAYDGLSQPVKTLLDGLRTIHRTSEYDQGGGRAPRRDGRSAGPFVSLHPLVRVHPETGERSVFFNPGTVSHVVGLKERESQAILDLLFHEITRPEYQARVHWRPNTIVMWDNQAVAHSGPVDYAQFDLPRAVRRVTVAGDHTTGPDGFRSRPIVGEPFSVIG